MEKRVPAILGATVSHTTRSTPIPSDTFLDDIAEGSPGLANFVWSDEMFELNADYLSVISSIRRLSSCLSVPCIFYNILLLTVLVSDKDFRSWQFFPMMMQCGMDAIGPGLANIVYNYQLESKAVTMNDLPVEFIWTEKKVPLKVFSYFGRYDGYDACAWTYLREYFIEVTTGICVCATALYRYLLVCHPTYKVEDIFYKKGAVFITSIIVFEIIIIITIMEPLLLKFEDLKLIRIVQCEICCKGNDCPYSRSRTEQCVSV